MLKMKEALDEFLSDRILQFNETTSEIEEYENKIEEIRKEILDLVPALHDKVWQLLDDLESSEGMVGAIREDLAYKQGVKDGLEMRELLK